MASETPTPLPGTDPKVFARFISKVNVTDGCWLWTASRFTGYGYGSFKVSGRNVTAHRFAWAVLRGPVPAGLCVLHNCPDGDNPLCVNPSHPWLGTVLENVADMDAKGRRAPASGDRHGSRTHPELVPRGERHGSKTHPEARPRGDAHYLRRHPEKIIRGIAHHWAKFNPVAAKVIRFLAARGVSHKRLAAAYGAGRRSIDRIVRGETWMVTP